MCAVVAGAGEGSSKVESEREEKGAAAAARRFLSLVFQWFLTSLSVLLSSCDAISDHLRLTPARARRSCRLVIERARVRRS
jgi:hypothetical protein